MYQNVYDLLALPIRKLLKERGFVEPTPPQKEAIPLILSGKNVPHIGRFTLTAFLIQIGMNIDDIVKLYTSATDFDERITRYQVEHIAGLVGGRTRYKPLNCESMQTHGLCVGRDEVCQKVKNPLAYYRRVAVRGKRVKHGSN